MMTRQKHEHYLVLPRLHCSLPPSLSPSLPLSLPPSPSGDRPQFVASITQVLLILGISTAWGIPNLLFASGDESVSEVILALQFLPLTRM